MAPKSLLKNLRSSIIGVLGENPSNPSVNELIASAHSLASAFLGSKLARGSLRRDSLEFHSFTISDFAYDCIADLFQRDESGKYIQLQTYFHSIAVNEVSEKKLLSHFRQLIFSKVNQSIFRIYNELDPSLGKILRNIKLALQSLKVFEEIERVGEVYLIPAMCDPNNHLPEISEDELERQIRTILHTSKHIPDVLAKLSLYLKKQNDWNRSVTLISIAVSLREGMAQPFLLGTTEPTVQQHLLEEDSKKIIVQASEEIQKINKEKYIIKKKMQQDEYNAYFCAIQQRLIHTIIFQDGEAFSYYNELQKHIADLTKQTYRRKHKNILEYLGRQVEKSAREMLKKEFK